MQGPLKPTLLITRTFTTTPAEAALSHATATTTATVGGSPAVLGTGGTLGVSPPIGVSVAFAWKPNPDVTLKVAGEGLTQATVQSVADGVIYRGGFYIVKACATGKPRVVGAMSRAAALAKVPGATAAKLAQTAEYYAADPACLQVCDPSVVVWVVAGNQPCPVALGLSESPPPSVAPVPTGPCWDLTVLNASTGVALPGIPEGQGTLPPWWATLTDYSS